MQTLKMNTIHARHSQANETPQHIVTHHMKHVFTPVNQTIKNNLPHITIC